MEKILGLAAYAGELQAKRNMTIYFFCCPVRKSRKNFCRTVEKTSKKLSKNRKIDFSEDHTFCV